MSNHASVNVGCLLVGEYVDEAGTATDLPSHHGEVVPMRVVASYLDVGIPDDGSKQFTVLLRDDRVVTVRGHDLKYVGNLSNPTEFGSYAILARTPMGEVTVALFRASEVTGVFSGNLQKLRESA